MICKNCGNDAYHIVNRFIDGKLVEMCPNCSNIPTNGPKTDDRGVRAIYTNDKGHVIPVDGRGNIVDKKDNPYTNDSRGWKHAGKKNIKY